jgi:hypothetical protein
MTRFLYASTLAVCPGVSFGEEDIQPETGEKASRASSPWGIRTALGLRTPGPSEFDSRGSLEEMATPGSRARAPRRSASLCKRLTVTLNSGAAERRVAAQTWRES